MSPYLSGLLPYFLSVAEAGSLTVAAREHAITQPALSRKIRQLEEGLGTKLFERHARGVVPTEAGRILMRRSRLMRIESRRALEELNLLRGVGDGHIVVSAGPVWALVVLPPIIARVREAFPGFTFEIRLAGAEPEIEAVASGDVDIYLGGLDVTAARHLGLEAVRTMELDYFVFGPDDHPLAEAGDDTAWDIAAQTWTAYDSDGAWPFFVEKVRREYGHSIAASTRCTSFTSTLAHARDGGSLVCMSHPLRGLARSFGLKPLPWQPVALSFPTGFCHGSSAAGLPPLAFLMDQLYESDIG
jgi:DNA-binding transcriptional LysR family regulator